LRGLVLGAEVQSAESNDGLLRHLPATDEFESFGDRLVGEVSVDLGEVAFSRQQLGKRGGSSTFKVIMISFQSTTPHFQCGVGARSYRTYRPSCRSLKMYGPVPAGRVS